MSEIKPRILFVEDDIGKRYAIARQLRLHGFEVDEAATGADGLAQVRAHHDVAILDIKLPDMMGWDVCAGIKSNPETSAVKVLELSATLATAEDRARGLELGADGYLVHPVEIVELVAALRSLVRLRNAERDKLRAQQLFLATLGHDLRNPLGTIATGIQLLGMSEALTESDRETVARIDRTLERMKRMIDQLVVFTQTLSDVVPVTRAPIDLGELCRIHVQDATHGSRRPIEVRIEPGVLVGGDPDRLLQLVDNLVANAIRHGDGAVTVTVGSDRGSAVLAVHNGGAPIAPAALATLFDPFTRANGRDGGLGLGLYIVDQIVRAHRGTVIVESTAEAGTTFTVNLPLAG